MHLILIFLEILQISQSDDNQDFTTGSIFNKLTKFLARL